MLIVCPACASEYRIEASRVGADGRSVRCASCRETWFISAADVAAAQVAELGEEAEAWSGALAAAALPAPAPAAETEPAPAPAAERKSRPRKAKKAPPLRRRTARFSPALAAGLALIAALPLAVVGRSHVVRAVPRTAGLYAALGLPVNLRGLDFRDVASFQDPAGAEKPARLVVEGDLVGLSAKGVPVPEIVVEVEAADGRRLRSFTAAAPRARLDAGESARFRATLDDPPPNGTTIRLRFAAVEPADAAARDSGQEPGKQPAKEPAAH